MFSRLIYSFTVLAVLAQPVFAARQSAVTPFEDLSTQLTLKAGQTYLGFMKKKVKPALDAFEATIQNDPAMQAGNWSLLQKNLIAQGAGVAIRIDDNNYIFNVGYLDGSDAANDVKSGRSYGVGPTSQQSDPSDIAYLTELENYLSSEPEATGDFVHALMLVLTNCDTSGWANLSEAGQIVATDFLAIYTAESDRHLMVNLSATSHPWEIDLAAATFVSIFDTATGLIMQDGVLTEGSIKMWWAKGTTGSGIGNTRKDRIALQRLIAQNDAESDLLLEISDVVGKSVEKDAIQGVLVYLNSSASPLTMPKGDAEQLASLMRDYLVHVQDNADQIAQVDR